MKSKQKIVILILFLLVAVAEAQSTKIQMYYYGWYDTPSFGGWRHWNSSYNNRTVQPPNDIHSWYYPQRGLYSSQDPTVIEAHMQRLKYMGVGVILMSWWGPGSFADQRADLILRKAKANGIKVAFSISTYPGRDIASVRRDIEYIHKTYVNKPHYSYWRIKRWTFQSPAPYPGAPTSSAKARPVIYIFATSSIPDTEWLTLLKNGLSGSIRGGQYDSVVLGHSLASAKIIGAGFDGLHFYDGVSDLMYQRHCAQSRTVEGVKLSSIYSASLSPGKWNPDTVKVEDRKMKDRAAGGTYTARWDAVKNTFASWASIITFNEWHEGTQVEQSVKDKAVVAPREIEWKDFDPLNVDGYEELTKTHAGQFVSRSMPSVCPND